MRKGNVWYLCKALEHVWSFSNTHPSVSDGPRQPVAQCYGWSILSAASDAAPSRAAVQILPLSCAEHLNTVFQLRAKDAVSISLFIYLYIYMKISLALKSIIKPTLQFCLQAAHSSGVTEWIYVFEQNSELFDYSHLYAFWNELVFLNKTNDWMTQSVIHFKSLKQTVAM